MADHLDRIGQQVGDYRLLRWLGGGGFGNVYLAEQVRDRFQVAIKLLQIRLSRSEELKAFINEARTIRLKHAHIVPLLDFGISREEIPFLVMEYAVQGTLRDRYPKGTQVRLTTVVSYVQQVASALQFAHEQRLVHRDVKPENMLLRADGTVLLSDFGIASVAHSSHSLSLHQGVGGTIPYMAPEQIQGQAQAASDQYSLGVVAYEWVAGRRPFEGTSVEVAMQHAMKSPPSLVEQAPTLSKEVEQVVFKALTKDPKQRFPSVQAFASALELASESTLTSLSPKTPLVSNPIISPIEPTISPNRPSFSRNVQVPPSPPTIPPSIASNSRRSISRRYVIIGLVAFAATGSLIWLSTSHPSTPIIEPPSPSSNRTSTPIIESPSPPSNRIVFTFKGHVGDRRGGVSTLAWSPDGKRIASAEKTILIWDAFTGKNIVTLQGTHSITINAIAWSPDGKYIATGGSYPNGDVQIWDAATGKIIIEPQARVDTINSITWSPDGKYIAAGGYLKVVDVWNATTGERLYTDSGYAQEVTGISWSRDSKRIAAVSYDGALQLWDPLTGANRTTYHLPNGAGALTDFMAWSSDGTEIAFATDRNSSGSLE